MVAGLGTVALDLLKSLIIDSFNATDTNNGEEFLCMQESWKDV